MHHFIVKTVDNLIESFELFFRHHIPLSSVLRLLFDPNPAIRRNTDGSTATLRFRDADKAEHLMRPLERDFFNTRKIIIVTTMPGSFNILK